MLENVSCEKDQSVQIKQIPFDFNLEDTDWTFIEMDESPCKRIFINKTIENKGKQDFSKISPQQITQTEKLDKSEDEFLNSEVLSEYLNSLQIDSNSSSLSILKPIPECPSCEEFSCNEDSCNFIPTLDTVNEVQQRKRKGSFDSKQTKTLTELKKKFYLQHNASD